LLKTLLFSTGFKRVLNSLLTIGIAIFSILEQKKAAINAAHGGLFTVLFIR